jgi:hypothetical protein
MDPKTSARTEKLLALGLTYDGQQLVYQDINFHWTDLVCMSDAQFDKAYEGAVKRKTVLNSTGNGGDSACFSK